MGSGTELAWSGSANDGVLFRMLHIVIAVRGAQCVKIQWKGIGWMRFAWYDYDTSMYILQRLRTGIALHARCNKAQLQGTLQPRA